MDMTPPPPPLKKPIITIWVHGAMPSKVGPSFLDRLKPDPIRNFFYCKPGLNKVSSLDYKYNHARLVKKLTEISPEQFPLETFYIFGWAGSISPADRIEAAKELLPALQTCIAKHTVNGQKPHLRVITHSHGGNVILNFVRLHKGDPPFVIDELILLACPVQQATARYIRSPFFNKIYAIHSHGDLIQVLDPQGWPELKNNLKKIFSTESGTAIKRIINSLQKKFFFSERHFDPQSNLTQVHLTYNGKTLPHIEFMMPSFTEKLPGILRILRKWEDGKINLPSDEHDVLLDINTKKTAT